jgi:hypothetical protein
MRPKKTKSYYVLMVSILALIMIGTALVFAIYRGFTKSQLPEEQTVLVRPFEGQLRPELWQGLANRRVFRQNDLDQIADRLAKPEVVDIAPQPAQLETLSDEVVIDQQPILGEESDVPVETLVVEESNIDI